jgi:hypothetical protein
MSESLDAKLAELVEAYRIADILEALAEICECESASLRRERGQTQAAIKWETAAGILDDASNEVEV